jgi:hypothetical protein
MRSFTNLPRLDQTNSLLALGRVSLSTFQAQQMRQRNDAIPKAQIACGLAFWTGWSSKGLLT